MAKAKTNGTNQCIAGPHHGKLHMLEDALGIIDSLATLPFKNFLPVQLSDDRPARSPKLRL